jgi:hypothetical protein
MMLCPLLVYWNCCLYSESFFMALSLLFISALFRDKKMALTYAVILLFSRPAGIFTILFGLMLRYVCKEKFSFKRSVLFLSAMLVPLFAFVFFFVELHGNGVAREILSGSVICGFPTHPMSEYLPLHFTMVKSYSYYLGQYGFADLAGVWMRRAISFFTLTRPYFSFTHNVINSVFSVFFLTNALAFILSFKQLKKYFSEIFYVQLLILLNCCLVILFFNEWNDRYTVVVFPYLFFTSAVFFAHLIKKEKTAI